MANEYKLSYTAADINKKLGQIESLASKDEVPTKLSDLVDDKGYLTTADVENQYALRPPALVSFIDDDCRIETYDKLFPIIRGLNIPYAIACPPGNIGVTDGYMTLDQFTSMANDENITVTCHHKTQTNMNTYASVDAYATDLDECLAWYEANGISNVRTICYPQGVYVDEYMQPVRDRFVMGFTVDIGINHMPQESYYMRRCELFSTNGKYTFDDAKELVSEVATNGGWLIFMTHAWYTTFDDAKLIELVQYIQGIGNVEIVGIDDAISKVGNKVEIGNFHKPIEDITNPYFVTDAFGNTYTNGYKSIDLTLRTGKLISPSGPVVSTKDVEYAVSEQFNIDGQSSVIVSGWASDGNGLYVFYDNSGNRKKVVYSTKTWSDDGDLLKNVEVQVPEGATKIAIAGYFRQQMPCLKVADTLNLGDLAAKDTVGRTDLAMDVQTSLGKADTALQSYTETDPTVPTWAKQPQKPTYTASEVGALPDTTKFPEKLPNPYPLTFTGAVDATYDGSKSVTVEISQGGGGSGGLSLPLLYEITTTEEVRWIDTGDNAFEAKNIIVLELCSKATATNTADARTTCSAYTKELKPINPWSNNLLGSLDGIRKTYDGVCAQLSFKGDSGNWNTIAYSRNRVNNNQGGAQMKVCEGTCSPINGLIIGDASAQEGTRVLGAGTTLRVWGC